MQSLQRVHSIILCGFLVTAVWYLIGIPVHAAEKVPIPSGAALDEALKLVKDVYGDEHAKAQSSEEKTAFAEKLLQTAKATNQGTANHYAILRVAWDIATQAGDAKLAMQITDQIAGVYEVNALSAKVATVKTTGGFVRSSAQRSALAMVALALGEEAVAVDDYDSAKELAAIGLAAARKAQNWQLVKQIVARDKAVKEAAEAYARVKEALDTLENSPTDPTANQVAGEYLCLVKGDWGKGIPMLALGSGEALKTLAQKDLRGTGDPHEQVALGDGWWNLAESAEAARRSALQSRAAHWYRWALPGLSGLAKTWAEKRLAGMSAAARSPKEGTRAATEAGNVALTSNGTTAAGIRKGASHLLDGVTGAQTRVEDRAHAESTWPCEWVITFSKAYQLREIRFQLYDIDRRFYRYAIETSSDGKNYTPLVDRSRGAWFSWQQIEFPPRPVKSIRLKGLYGSENQAFHVFEFEAYCIPPESPPR